MLALKIADKNPDNAIDLVEFFIDPSSKRRIISGTPANWEIAEEMILKIIKSPDLVLEVMTMLKKYPQFKSKVVSDALSNLKNHLD